MTGFIIKTQGLDANAARKAAKGMLAKLSAWKALPLALDAFDEV